jgi:hypothetical protein
MHSIDNTLLFELNHSLRKYTMKNILNTLIASAIVSVAAIGSAQAATPADSTQPYIWTSGELGLIANPAYKAPTATMADRTPGIYLVGTGENGLIANKAFAKLAATPATPLFKAGVGEISLIDLKPVAGNMNVAAK